MKQPSRNNVARTGTAAVRAAVAVRTKIDKPLRRSRASARRTRDLPSRRAAGARTAGNHFCYYMDAEGRQHFNFIQRLWIRSQVDMAVTPVMTVALQTLAINLLAHVTHPESRACASALASNRMHELAHRFCLECLLTARSDGWVMPRASVAAWLSTRRRRQSRTRH